MYFSIILFQNSGIAFLKHVLLNTFLYGMYFDRMKNVSERKGKLSNKFNKGKHH